MIATIKQGLEADGIQVPMGFTRFSGHLHLASKPPLELGWADVTQR